MLVGWCAGLIMRDRQQVAGPEDLPAPGDGARRGFAAGEPPPNEVLEERNARLEDDAVPLHEMGGGDGFGGHSEPGDGFVAPHPDQPVEPPTPPRKARDMEAAGGSYVEMLRMRDDGAGGVVPPWKLPPDLLEL
ncbi:hypothetical protein NR798_24150 [Archangium gephyra]|uniref:hypothetical protein n=1 Tax=Archangium gephyra TaxID=48 RepID=UPI0035D4A2F5